MTVTGGLVFVLLVTQGFNRAVTLELGMGPAQQIRYLLGQLFGKLQIMNRVPIQKLKVLFRMIQQILSFIGVVTVTNRQQDGFLDLFKLGFEFINFEGRNLNPPLINHLTIRGVVIMALNAGLLECGISHILIFADLMVTVSTADLCGHGAGCALDVAAYIITGILAVDKVVGGAVTVGTFNGSVA